MLLWPSASPSRLAVVIGPSWGCVFLSGSFVRRAFCFLFLYPEHGSQSNWRQPPPLALTLERPSPDDHTAALICVSSRHKGDLRFTEHRAGLPAVAEAHGQAHIPRQNRLAASVLGAHSGGVHDLDHVVLSDMLDGLERRRLHAKIR